MPDFLKNLICWIGVSYMLYRFYYMVVSTVKILVYRNKTGSKDISNEQR
jgi:hypothetical protein